MIVTAHEGRCCGISVISGLPVYSAAALAELNQHIAAIKNNRAQGCIELVLIDQQMNAELINAQIYGGQYHHVGGWAEPLRRKRFKIVARFQNSNHGNWCNVLHLHYGQPRVRLDPPFEWGDNIPPTNIDVGVEYVDREVRVNVPGPERAVEVPRAIPRQVEHAAVRVLDNPRSSVSSRRIAEYIQENGEAREG